MSTESNDSHLSIDELFSAIQEAYIDDKFAECLILSCDLFKRTCDGQHLHLRDMAVEFLYKCAEQLRPLPDEIEHAVTNPFCSFCGKSPPEVRLGAGHSSFICHQCVALFSNILK